MTSTSRGARGHLRAFDRAAPTYEANAAIQRTVAERLAKRIAGLPLPPHPRVLEIGCGTGFLSAALRERLSSADWTLTDIAPAMVAACRARLGEPADTAFLVMDGEHPSLPPGFDLICASLAFQWFGDLPAALPRLVRLLNPGGHLAFATLAEDSLREWKQAHAELGFEPGVLDFPTIPALKALAPGIQDEQLIQLHAEGRAFLAGLKGIGGHSPRENHRPLAPAALKRVISRFEALGAACTYHVAYGVIRHAAAPRGVFVTGTDTGIGKTVVSALLARAWSADYWKPVQTGFAEDEGDTAIVARLSGLVANRLHPPRHAFAAPLSPHRAATLEGRTIRLKDFALPDSERPVVVEGAGGPLVPLNDHDLMIDLMARFGLPVVVVAADRLGGINHALLALEAIRARGLRILGVVLIGGPFADNRAAIETHGGVPVIAALPWADGLGPGQIEAWAADVPSLASLIGVRVRAS